MEIAPLSSAGPNSPSTSIDITPHPPIHESFHLESLEEDNGDPTRVYQEAAPTATETHIPIITTRLPRVLYMLYALNGLTLALFMLPMMYIVNTKVQVPVAFLSTYGSVTFLPYSFKPIYAYLSSSPEIRIPFLGYCTNNNNNNNLRHVRLPPRYAVYITLLVMNSLCFFLYACIPQGGVIAIFVVGFFKGMSDAWSVLCLALTLIDTARHRSSSTAISSMHSSSPNTTTTTHLDDTAATTIAALSSDNDGAQNNITYDKLASQFQAQAATARNIGSVIGGTITLLVFVERYLSARSDSGAADNNDQPPQLTGGVASGLLFFASGLDLIGAVAAFLLRDALKPHPSTERSDPSFSLLQQQEDTNNNSYNTETIVHPNNASVGNLLNRGDNQGSMDVEGDGLMMTCDDNRSYGSCSSSSGSNELLVDDEIEAIDVSGQPIHSTSASLACIVMLQLVIVLIVLKDPVSEWTSSFIWKALTVTTSLGFLVAIVTLWFNSSWQSTHRIGLFLILRNAIPSDAMVTSSFTYSIFQSQPILLQTLSVVSLVVLMAASWSYEKIWARFSQGGALTAVMGFLVVLSGMASLLNIALFRKYEELISMDSNDLVQNVLGIAVVASVATTFFSEWAFLPEVVLASVSVRGNEKPRINQEGRSTSDPNSSEEQHETNHSSNIAAAVEYGSLISCIEFGDQLGALLAAPIVSSLGISRENDFKGMDQFLFICIISTIIGTLALLPLTRKG